jgi:cyclase
MHAARATTVFSIAKEDAMTSAQAHHDEAGLGTPRVEEVSDRVFAYIQPDGTWFINNTGFLAGASGVTSVDACSTERRTRAYLEAIARTSPQPVRTLINTHHHGDHTNGNYLFGGATIVAHDRCRDEVLAAWPPGYAGIFADVDWGEVLVAPPFLTYSDRITLYSDDLRCEVRHVGAPAHTTNDSIVWLPERSVLFAGDLIFNGGTPFMLMGSVAGAIDVLERVVRPLSPATIVPGHGEVCGPEVIDDVLGYLRFVLDVARRGRAAGLSPLEAARETGLGAYAGLTDRERIVGNLHRAYADLGGGEPGEKLNVPAVFADMVAYNGGQPLSCLA